MIKPNPFKLICPNCNYAKVVKPQSDNLNILDASQPCPKCDTLMNRTKMSDSNTVFQNIFSKLFGR